MVLCEECGLEYSYKPAEVRETRTGTSSTLQAAPTLSAAEAWRLPTNSVAPTGPNSSD